MNVDISGALRIDGKVALITGGSKGIGLSTARHFVAAGGSVVLVARGADALRDAATELSEAGGRVLTVVGDVTDPTTRDAAISRCVHDLGSLDILVNNAAGSGPICGLIDAPEADMREVIEVDLLAPLLWSQAAWRAWMSEHGGAIVNISSMAGLVVRPNHGAYGQCKAALDHITRYLALELAPGVRVNSVAPGLVLTELTIASTTEEHRREAAIIRPLQRLGDPADIARAVLFIASDAGGWVTGQVFAVEGGGLLRA